jgi:hypothetical protein
MSIRFLLWYAPDTAFRRAASHRLQAHFPDKSVRVWRSTRSWQSRLAPNRPRHTANVNLMMRYMEWSCALYRAVQEHGMSQADAAELVETIYFKDQGVPELTEPAAGNLDYRMAREWGVELVRTQTIADGAAHCDFRWTFPATGAD